MSWRESGCAGDGAAGLTNSGSKISCWSPLTYLPTPNMTHSPAMVSTAVMVSLHTTDVTLDSSLDVASALMSTFVGSFTLRAVGPDFPVPIWPFSPLPQQYRTCSTVMPALLNMPAATDPILM